jgi:small subunit ribosomal protein S20
VNQGADLDHRGACGYRARLFFVEELHVPAKPSAAKRARQALKRRARNRAYKSALHTSIKRVEVALAAGDKEAARSALAGACASLDKTASKGVIHRNAAARRKSRLTRRVAAMA